MIPPRIFFYVQHLLGIGHLKRAALLSRGLAAAGLDVDLISGGMPVSDLDTGDANLHQLRPLRCGTDGFNDLVDEAGHRIDESWKVERRDRLLDLFRERNPDVVIIEAYPFGRRQMRFELSPLLDTAHARDPRPCIICSVRDILQTNRSAERIAETVEIILTRFDYVFVHGDPQFALFEETFPGAHAITGKLRYTGLIAEPPGPPSETRAEMANEVVVSAGGGVVGANLLATAIRARPLTSLKDAPWRLLAGPNMGTAEFSAIAKAAPAGVPVECYRQDFPSLLARSVVSVSQGGYNTVMDVLRVRTRAVIVPYAERGETEQSLRARRLAERGLVQVVDEATLSPESLARAIDTARTAPPASGDGLDMDGAANAARLVAACLAGQGTAGA